MINPSVSITLEWTLHSSSVLSSHLMNSSVWKYDGFCVGFQGVATVEMYIR